MEDAAGSVGRKSSGRPQSDKGGRPIQVVRKTAGILHNDDDRSIDRNESGIFARKSGSKAAAGPPTSHGTPRSKGPSRLLRDTMGPPTGGQGWPSSSRKATHMAPSSEHTRPYFQGPDHQDIGLPLPLPSPSIGHRSRALIRKTTTPRKVMDSLLMRRRSVITTTTRTPEVFAVKTISAPAPFWHLADDEYQTRLRSKRSRGEDHATRIGLDFVKRVPLSASSRRRTKRSKFYLAPGMSLKPQNGIDNVEDRMDEDGPQRSAKSLPRMPQMGFKAARKKGWPNQNVQPNFEPSDESEYNPSPGSSDQSDSDGHSISERSETDRDSNGGEEEVIFIRESFRPPDIKDPALLPSTKLIKLLAPTPPPDILRPPFSLSDHPSNAPCEHSSEKPSKHLSNTLQENLSYPPPEHTSAPPELSSNPPTELLPSGPSEELISAIESLTLSPTYRQKAGRLPFLRRNLRTGFLGRCRSLGVATNLETGTTSVDVRYEYCSAPGIIDHFYVTRMESWVCPLCELHNAFRTREMLASHLNWDHDEVRISWEWVGTGPGAWLLRLTIVPISQNEPPSTPRIMSRESSTPRHASTPVVDEKPATTSVSPFPYVTLSPPGPSPVVDGFQTNAATKGSPKLKFQLPIASPTPSRVTPQTGTSISRSTTVVSSSSLSTQRADPLGRYPTPPPPNNPLGPSAQYPFLPAKSEYGGPDIDFSCRPDGPCLYDLLNTLPLEPFGVLSWDILDREDEIYDSDNVKDEYKVMHALWARWIILNRKAFIKDYYKGTIAFVDAYWRMIHRAAGWDALRYWLLMLLANRFINGHDVANVLKHYEGLTGMAFWYE